MEAIAKKDAYDAFVFPDGFVMYRHEAEAGGRSYTEEQLRDAHIVIHPKGSADWHHVVDDLK